MDNNSYSPPESDFANAAPKKAHPFQVILGAIIGLPLGCFLLWFWVRILKLRFVKPTLEIIFVSSGVILILGIIVGSKIWIKKNPNYYSFITAFSGAFGAGVFALVVIAFATIFL